MINNYVVMISMIRAMAGGLFTACEMIKDEVNAENFETILRKYVTKDDTVNKVNIFVRKFQNKYLFQFETCGKDCYHAFFEDDLTTPKYVTTLLGDAVLECNTTLEAA